MAYYENSHTVRDGAILLYTRPGRKKTTWQTRLCVSSEHLGQLRA